jgi:hypothetical protein
MEENLENGGQNRRERGRIVFHSFLLYPLNFVPWIKIIVLYHVSYIIISEN